MIRCGATTPTYDIGTCSHKLFHLGGHLARRLRENRLTILITGKAGIGMYQNGDFIIYGPHLLYNFNHPGSSVPAIGTHHIGPCPLAHLQKIGNTDPHHGPVLPGLGPGKSEGTGHIQVCHTS